MKIDDKTLIQDLSYIAVPEDRIGIVGPNGSGKSTLLNLIAGRIQPGGGEVVLGPTVKLGYFTQEHQEMDGSQRVIEYIKDEAEVVRTADGSAITAAQMLERFLFPPALQWTPIAKLSGGEKRRLYLLRVLMSAPNVLLLDEPTNDLDIQTLSVLEQYLMSSRASVSWYPMIAFSWIEPWTRLWPLRATVRFVSMWALTANMRNGCSVTAVKLPGARRKHP